jgi:hypothetical protein
MIVQENRYYSRLDLIPVKRSSRVVCIDSQTLRLTVVAKFEINTLKIDAEMSREGGNTSIDTKDVCHIVNQRAECVCLCVCVHKWQLITSDSHFLQPIEQRVLNDLIEDQA